jgi:hypothetical protein
MNYPIYLLFSVNGSGRFLGVALMTSLLDSSKDFMNWSQKSKWKGYFQVKWIIIKDVPNKVLKKLTNSFNENKSVVASRDTQEIEKNAGAQMLKIISDYDSKSSILDDFDIFKANETNY